VRPEGRSPLDRTGAFVGFFFQITFWVPLGVCTWFALIPDPPDNAVFRLGDVVLHAFAFTYLSLALVMARQRVSRTPEYVRTAVLMFGYGLMLEAIQFFIPERSAELKDLLVDATGITLGLLLARGLARPAYDQVLRLSARR
jgi:VanZ family protein